MRQRLCRAGVLLLAFLTLSASGIAVDAAEPGAGPPRSGTLASDLAAGAASPATTATASAGRIRVAYP